MGSMSDHGKPSQPNEVMLELVQSPEGDIALRPVNGEGDALVTIHFSEQVHELLGEQLQGVGQHMIQAALQLIMQQQAARWHAAVVDDMPAHFS